MEAGENLLSESLPDVALLHWELGFLHPCSSIPRLGHTCVSGKSAALSNQTLILEGKEERAPFGLAALPISHSCARLHLRSQLCVTEGQAQSAGCCTGTRRPESSVRYSVRVYLSGYKFV